jgi:hypothetical protein
MIDELKPHLKFEALPVRKVFGEVHKTLLLIQRQQSGQLSPEANTFLQLAKFDAEVSNGGLAQYFTNPGGRDYPAVLEGFRRLQLAKQVDLLERWVRLLPADIEISNSDAIGRHLFSNPELFQKSQDLDAEYYRCKDECLAALVEWALK